MFACDEGHSICLTFVRRAYAVKGKAVNTQVDGECRPDSVLRMRKVVDRLGISRSTIYDWMNPKSPRYDSTFPLPIKLSGKCSHGAVGWLESDIIFWIQSRKVITMNGAKP